MPGLGTKLWVALEQVTAAGLNGYVQDQVVAVYANAAARDAAYGGAGEPTLSEGMICYVSDVNSLFYYSGTSWSALGEDDQFILSSQVFG
jgi:hypothetical protein